MAIHFRQDVWVRSAVGPAVPGAQVWIVLQPANLTLPPTPIADIFADVNGLIPIVQPLITDGFGHVAYYTLPGFYTMIVALGGRIQQVYIDQNIAEAGELSVPITAGTGIFVSPTNVISTALLAGIGIDPSLLNLGTVATKLNAGTGITLTGSVPAGLTISATGGGGGTATGLQPLAHGAPDQTGNSFYGVLTLSNWFSGHWEYTRAVGSFINFSMRLPSTLPATASIVLEVWSGDATAGHTANFQTSDAIAGASLNVGALTAAPVQGYTTTATANSRSTLVFPVQTALVVDGVLVIKVAMVPTGTAPSTNIYVLPYLKLT